MDPLSITAGIIAVLGAASKTGSTANKLRSLRKAPEELEFLLNEIEALKNVLLIIQTSLRSIQGTQPYTEIAEPLSSLLRRAESAVTEFHSLLEYQLKRSEETDKRGRVKVDRSEWLRAGPGITRIRQQIRDARDDLHTALSAFNLSTGVATRQLVLQIQSVQVTEGRAKVSADCSGQALLDQLSSAIPNQDACALPAANGDRGIRNLNAEQDERYLDPHDRTSTEMSIVSNSNALQHSPVGLPRETLTITTTVSHYKCPPFCGCQCHARTRGRTPMWLKNVIGELMFDYTSLIYITPCNKPHCQKSVNKSHFTYRFPSWMASRMIFLSGGSVTALGAGAEWSLRIPVVVDDYKAWSVIILSGNSSMFRGMLANREVSPHTLDRSGRCLVQCAFLFGRTEIYDMMIQSGFHRVLESPAVVSTRTAKKLVKNSLLGPEDVSEYLSFTELHHSIAFWNGNDDLILECVRQNPNQIKEQDRAGQTPLHWACCRNSLTSIKLLLAWNADPNARALDGSTALHHACQSGTPEAVQALLTSGAWIDAVDDGGLTPLLGTIEPDIIQLLARHGANFLHQDNRGWNCLHHSATRHPKAIQTLVREGADYGQVSRLNGSAAHAAILNNSENGLRHLRDTHGTYPPEKRPITVQGSMNFLHCAALFAGPEVMKELAKWDLRGHDPYAKYEWGNTPDEAFKHFRDVFCTIIRPSIEEEEEAWIALMESAARQNGCEYQGWIQKLGDETGDESGDEDVGSDGAYSMEGEADDGTPSEDEGPRDVFVDAVEAVENTT